MLRELVQGPARKIYCGTGRVLLLLVPLHYVFFPYFMSMVDGLQVSGVICLATLSYAVALLQDEAPLPARVRTLLAWSYAAGMVLVMAGFYPWLHGLLAVVLQDSGWENRMGSFVLVSPPMMLLPVVAVFIGVVRSARKWPEQTYLLGGLCLVILYIGRIWLSLYGFRFGVATNVSALFVQLFWILAHPVVATVGMILGCAPPEFHPPARLGSAIAICYLVAALLAPLGLWVDLSEHSRLALAVVSAITLGVLAPASVVTGNWIVFALRRRSR